DNNVTWNGPLAGSGTLTKNAYFGLVLSPIIGNSAGTCALELVTNSPGFSGGIVVNTGTLIASSALKLGDDVSPGNTLTINGPSAAFRASGSFAMNRGVSIGAGG